MSQAFVGEIRLFPYTFAPQGWAYCNGALLPIASYTLLYSIIGTTYGGNGVNTFAVPDMRGRAPMHFGQGPGLTMRSFGRPGGSSTVALTEDQLPSHTHTLSGDDVNGTQGTPSGQAYPARDAQNKRYEPNPLPANMVAMGAQALATAGSGQAHDNMQPYLAVNHCICLEGQYPTRN